MTKGEWVAVCGEALYAKGIAHFHPLEIADVGREAFAISDRTHKPRWKVALKAPSLELIPNALMLCELLCELREADPFGPVLVNSWYRDRLYNYSIGGVARSMHKTCGAADITKIGWTTDEVATWLEAHSESGNLGVGRYKTFTHIDIRGKLGRLSPARWGSSE